MDVVAKLYLIQGLALRVDGLLFGMIMSDIFKMLSDV